MRWAPLAVVAPLALVCCGPEGPINPVGGPPIGYSSGTRLRARAHAGTQGSHLLLGWQDKLLGTQCRFATAEDGETRCMPVGANVVFLDELCKTPIAVVDSACFPTPPPFASATFAGDACGGAAHAFRVGDPIPVPRGHVYLGAGATGACSRAVQLDVGAATYALEEVPADQLVKGTLTREKTTDRLGLEVLVTDDGAREVRGLYDIATKGRCFSIAGAIGGGEDHCVPDAVAWATYAADAACKEPVAYQVRPQETCPEADVVVSYANEGCGVRASFFARGPSVSIDDVFSGLAPLCTAVRTMPTLYGELELDHVFFGVGAPIPAASFAPLATKPIGQGRLAVPTLSTADGIALTPARADTFYDTTLGMPCRGYLFPDGTKRCVPADAPGITTATYLDDACSQEIVGIARASGCTDSPPPAYAVRVAGNACGTDTRATEVVKLAGEYRTLSAYYVKDTDDACTKRDGEGSYVAVSRTVPASSLGAIIVRVE